MLSLLDCEQSYFSKTMNNRTFQNDLTTIKEQQRGGSRMNRDLLLNPDSNISLESMEGLGRKKFQ